MYIVIHYTSYAVVSVNVACILYILVHLTLVLYIFLGDQIRMSKSSSSISHGEM